MRFELARTLQDQFAAQCPAGWTCRREHPVLAREFVDVLGYRPQADVMLECAASRERIWIELEVSRADPVANHAKFGSAHLIQPFPENDTFVSMVSRDIVPGRANLAAHAIFMLRRLGLRAFQMPLLPQLSGPEIKRLNQNQAGFHGLPSLGLDRVIELTHGLAEAEGVHIHYATNAFEVMLNLAQWNRDVLVPGLRALWRTRHTKYFVADLKHGWFAPSKFCAYTLMPCLSNNHLSPPSPVMAMSLYTRIDQSNSIFDGQKAWKNLANLGFDKLPLAQHSEPVRRQFAHWLQRVSPAIDADPNEVQLLTPP